MAEKQTVTSVPSIAPPILRLQLGTDDYNRFQALILERTGMIFGSRRGGALAGGVKAMAAKNGCRHLEAYFHQLKNTPTDHTIWDELIDEITVCETYFFRDAAQFGVLRHHIFPELFSRHQHDRRLRIWSAGCASGEEPYSLSMLLDEMLAGASGWHIHILATDINKRVLKKAQRGVYREWSFRQTEPAAKSRYFKRDGEAYTIHPRVKDRVRFAHLNLNEDGYPSLTTNTNAMDLILFRNVAIYQSESVIRAVAAKFHDCLAPGGWLMVGASEVGIPAYGQYAARNFPGATVFQKTSDGISSPPALAATGTASTAQDAWVGSPQRSGAVGHSPHLSVAAGPVNMPSSASKKAKPPVETASDELQALYAQGQALAARKQYPDAMTAFQTCVALNGTFAPAFFHMARIQANMGQLEAAESLCRQALAHNPLLVEAHYTLALIHQEAGCPEAAIAGLKKAVFLDANLVLGHFTLAVLYHQTGMRTHSERHRRQAVRLASTLPPETILPGADDLTAGQMLSMANILI